MQLASTVEGLRLLGSALAFFLIGANVAFIFTLGSEIVSWFRLKIAATTGLLVYIVASMLMGQPAMSRIIIAIVALLLDVAAILIMWRSIEYFRAAKIRGLIPLIPDREVVEKAASPLPLVVDPPEPK